MTFRLEARPRDGARASAGWVFTRRSRIVDAGYLVFPLKREQIVEDVAVMTMLPERSGTYWYSIQLDDLTGRTSNVLEGSMVVYAAPQGKPPECP